MSSAAPTRPHDLDARVRAAQDALRHSAAVAGLAGDPLRVAIDALSEFIGAHHAMHTESERSLAELVRAARQPISEDDLRRLEQAAVTGADRRALRLAQEHWRRNVLLAAGALFGAAVVAGAAGVACGYAWGHANALASVHHTEAGLREMFANGPGGAALWRDWAAWNDPQKAVAACKGAAVAVQDGRRACTVPLWIEGPPKQN